MGRILFNILINDIVEVLNIEGAIFDDETKLCKMVNTIEDSALLQMDLDRLEVWSGMWQMRFNTDTCKVMQKWG